MNRALTLLCLCLLVAAPVWAGDGGVESPFGMGAGARELSLGSTGILTSDASTAPFWNPSILADAQYPTVGGYHSSLLVSGAAYQYVGLAWPTLDFGAFGLGVFRLGVDDIEERDDQNLLLGNFSEQRLGFYVSYGRWVGDYRIGLTTHFEHHALADRKATSTPGLNFAIGRQLMTGTGWAESCEIALVLRNVVSPEMTLLDEPVKFPFHADIGSRMVFAPDAGRNHRAELAVSLGKTEGSELLPSVGIEYSLYDILSLRGGRNTDRFSCGAGIHYGALTFDYAVVERDLGSVHMFSLSTALGTSVEERRASREKRREIEFDRLMTSRVAAQNRDMIGELTETGRVALATGNLPEAVADLDRALFLCRTADVDTTEVASLAATARTEFDNSRRRIRLNALLDSATVKFNQGDMIGTSFYASLALADDPASDSAADLANRAGATLQEAALREEMLRTQVYTIDSLVTFGRLNEAAALCRTLEQYAPDHPAIVISAKRVQFETWRRAADAAAALGDWATASRLADSINSVYPGHEWVRSFRQRITQTSATPPPAAANEIQPVKAVVSAAARKEAESAYQTGQKAFAAGRLDEAIVNWEQVERIAPDHRSVRDYLFRAYKLTGIDLYGQNRLDEAIAVWQKALKLVPDNPEIANYIARTRVELMKLGEAGNGN
jgi:tetratricopeptide (TPR) repeat protein